MAVNDNAYFVEISGDRYEVRSANGRVVMRCRDQASADHYAVLLCEAYRAGFKKGYKKARAE